METHKPLAVDFRASGFEMHQMMRSESTALYRKTRIGSGAISYEVVRIKKHNGYEIKGVKCEPSEFYPSSESWGTDGFTFTEVEYDRALSKFRAMETNRAKQ
jgi:hypothetical protein